MAAKSTTASRLAKTKKPLSEMHQLQRAVKELQREAAEQLVLEVESQATFEFLTSQVQALKSAFDTLADVLMNEVDSVRKETQRKLRDMDALVTRQAEMHKATRAEVLELKRALDIWGLKERDWAKDNEILKASHAHNVEWMQQLQRDGMDVKDRVHALQTDVAHRLAAASEEAANLRGHWQKQVDVMTARLEDFASAAHAQVAGSRAQTQQRVDDMELMEQAFRSLQMQQQHVRASLEDLAQRAGAQHALAVKKMEALESQCSAQRTGVEQLKAKSASLEKEQRRRMENISKMFTVFAEALNLPQSAVGRIA
ncbi:hypothetical protein PybrP1_007476 [[Pythium] brassicae (nom. inval.)]|nr:hypothetical protein PybrP1_007476 [[Pythium] brassicae (nom. inval.)]